MGCRKGKDDCLPKQAQVKCKKCGALAKKRAAVCRPEPLEPVKLKVAESQEKGAEKKAHGKKHDPEHAAHKHKQDEKGCDKSFGAAGSRKRGADDEPPAEAFGVDGMILESMQGIQKESGSAKKHKKKHGGEKKHRGAKSGDAD